MAHGNEELWVDSKSSTASAKVVKLSSETKKSNGKTGRGDKVVGSRRIFSPLFKLQVLDSYRQDADCQGNQRATARKYGIHRRQIQKWLQMETSLRLSVQQPNSSMALNLSSATATATATRQLDDSISSDSIASSIPSPAVSTTSKSSSISPSISISCCNFKENSCSDSEEYINVDEITDSEADDDDLSSCCSTYEKALDFTCATLSKRRVYTSDFKLHVLDAFKNDVTCKGNQRATARKFGIHRRQVQKWLNQENSIKYEHSLTDDTCLDLSRGKRKLEHLDSDFQVPEAKRKMTLIVEDEGLNEITSVQESALCLVKGKSDFQKGNNSEVSSTDNLICRPIYPSSPIYPNLIEHSYHGASLSYSNSIPTEYPMYCLCQPWNYCYQQISPLRTASIFESSVPHSSKYMYYETSYVDIPLQYGFAESKWTKDTPLYLPERSNLPLLSSYR